MQINIAHRREDARLLRGQGLYVHDVSLPGMLYAAFVRSPVARGRIARMGTTCEGVVAVLSANDLGKHAMPPVNPLLPVQRDYDFPVLPLHEVSYAGQPLAVVLAHSRDAARQAVDVLQAKLVIEEAPSDEKQEPWASIEWGKASAPQGTTVNAEIHSPRLQAMSLEPRAAVIAWDEVAQQLTSWLPTQTPSRAQADLAKCLGLDQDKVRVIAPDVGGAFGAKASLCIEDFALALAARHTKCAVNWQSSRSEEFLSGMHGRGSQLQGSLTVDAQGKFLALDAQVQMRLGAWLPYSVMMPLRNATRILPGPYRVAQVHVSGHATGSHTAPVNIYRGAGRPEAALLMETLVDIAARALQIDPVDLRVRNLIAAHEMPHTTPSGEVLDSGDYVRALAYACDSLGYEAVRKKQAQQRLAGEVVGIGVAMYIEPCGQGWEAARVTLHANSKITVASGSPAQGQGHASSFAKIAFDTLSPHIPCKLDEIEVLLGDTQLCPEGIGALASRSIAIGGSAIVQACEQLLTRVRAGEQAPLVEEARFTANEAWSYGCVIACVAIDRDTGELAIERIVWADDAGRIISPQLAKGQLIGGLAQGLGQAMMECIRYDAQGQLLTGSLMDYAVPRASDMPGSIQIESFATPSPNNLLGAKGVGEAGCIGVPAALMNAARDALSPWGEQQLSFPLNPEQLWRCMTKES
jgi:aerobic carbon-monoxide dehydrogenase large subunit